MIVARLVRRAGRRNPPGESRTRALRLDPYIIGKANGSSMIWLAERVTRYSIAVTLPCGYTADEVLAGLVVGLEQIPSHMLRSLTFDQGSEWAEWETIAVTYGIDCWFCDPHSPWHRDQIENHNRQARWWFQRGTRLDNITQTDADHAAAIINGQRRRNLNNHSPAMLYAAACCDRVPLLTHGQDSPASVAVSLI
jgi:transposase, IS30 family